MNCEEFRAHMGRYLEGALQGPRLTAFERHRAECLLCRERLDEETEFESFMTASLTPPELGTDLTDAVMDRIRNNEMGMEDLMSAALTPPVLSEGFVGSVMARVRKIATRYDSPIGLWKKLRVGLAVASAAGLLIVASIVFQSPTYVTPNHGGDTASLDPVPVTYAGMLERGEVCVVSKDLDKSEWKREKDTKLPADSWIVNASKSGAPARVKLIGGATVDLEAGSAIKPAMNPDGPGLLIEQISGRAYFENADDAFDLVVITPGDGAECRRFVATRDCGVKVSVGFESDLAAGDASDMLRIALEHRGRARSDVMAIRGMLRIDGCGSCMQAHIEAGQHMRFGSDGSECLELRFVGSAVGLTEGGVTTMVFQNEQGVVKVQKLGVPTSVPGQFPRPGAVLEEELFPSYERFAETHPDLAERVPKLDISGNGFDFRWEMDGHMPDGTNIFVDEVFRGMNDPDSAVGQSLGGMFEGKSWEEIIESLTPEQRKELEEHIERMQKLWESIHRGNRNRHRPGGPDWSDRPEQPEDDEEDESEW